MIISEDNEAVIKICLKGRSQALRHLHRTHRVAVDWIYDMIKANWVVLEHVNTKVQIADIFTKAIVKSESWLRLTDLAQIRAVKSGKPPVIDLVKKPKKKKIDSDSNREQVSPSPKAKPKKKSAKKKVAAAVVLSATAVNLVGCQLLTLSRVDGFLGTLGMRSFTQAPTGAKGVPIPGDQLSTPLLPLPDSNEMPLNWQRKAKEVQDRLGQGPLRSIAAEQMHQQTLAAAEGGDGSDVGGTPVLSAPSEATAANSPRSWFGGIASWWAGECAKPDTPTTQAQTEAPKHDADDERMDPGLMDTSASGLFSSQDNMRSRLVPNVRANLQKLCGTQPTQGCDERPPAPPVPEGGGLPAPTPMAERPLNIPS